MSFTFTEHTTDGVTTTFPFRFAGKDKAYIRSTDVVVFLKTKGVWTEARNWTLSGTNQITFATAPAVSTEVNLRIRRIVPKVDPYAEFARGVALDVRSMNYAFIQELQVVQELMDGFFPEGFFYKEDLNMGFNKVINLAPGTNPGDAVNFEQLTAIDKKHTAWNQEQDMAIAGLKAAATSGVGHRTVPWLYNAVGGETVIAVPYTFESALVFINGVLQFEMAGAVSFNNNNVLLAEKLIRGDQVLVLVGSRIAPPEDQAAAEINIQVVKGTTVVDLKTSFLSINVYLDGLKQPSTSYAVSGQKVTFNEPLPECMLSALVVIPKGGS